MRSRTKLVTIKILSVTLLGVSLLAESSRAFVPGVSGNTAGAISPSSPVRRPIHCRQQQQQQHLRWRGGNSLKQNADIVQHENGGDFIEERFRKRGMMVALASTYLTVMGAKCALPSVLSLLTSRTRGLVFPAAETMSPQSRMAALLGMSTLAVAFGKLSLGPVIDTLGGINSLKIALSTLMLLLITISFAQPFTLFAICWIGIDFIFSSCWASCINAIHQSFPEKEWGKQIGILAVGARTGNTLAFAMFSSILRSLEGTVKQPWRQIFAISAMLQLVPLSLVTYFGRKTVMAESADLSDKTILKPSFQTSLTTIRREASTSEFWLHLLSRSVLMVFASFLMFVPTLMSQVYGTSNAIAAQGASLYSLGCLLSVTFGSSWYSKLPKPKQALVSVGLTAMATVSSLLQLGHVSGFLTLSATGAAATMFLWGFAFSIPFYLPPSLYALSRGGRQSSATIADAFDIGGFLLLALFNSYVASIDHGNPIAWIPTFFVTTACSLISMLSLPMAILRQ